MEGRVAIISALVDKVLEPIEMKAKSVFDGSVVSPSGVGPRERRFLKLLLVEVQPV